jgi:uncharacterized Zn-finger protein
LNVHLRVHRQERENVCTFPNCGKAFVRTSELYAHERSHDNLLPHACEFCGKRFRETSRLKRHRNSIHASQVSLPEAPAQTTV